MTYRSDRLFVFGLLLLLAACQTGRVATEKAAEPPAVEVSEFETESGEVRLFTRLAARPGNDCLLIAINGGPGLSSDYMRDLEQLAEKGCDVATYDQRGTGRSTVPETESPASYTLELYAADLEAVRQAAAGQRGAGDSGTAVHLFGHSFGAMLASYYAGQYPEQVASLSFFGGGPPSALTMSQAQARFGRRIDDLISAGLLAPPEEWTGEGIEPFLSAYFSDPSFTFPEGGPGGAPSYSDRVNQLTNANLGTLNLRPVLAEFARPVLILYGRDDPFGLEMAEATRNALTSAEVTYEIIDDCGHFWHECPAAFYAHLVDFLGLEGE